MRDEMTDELLADEVLRQAGEYVRQTDDEYGRAVVHGLVALVLDLRDWLRCDARHDLRCPVERIGADESECSCGLADALQLRQRIDDLYECEAREMLEGGEDA